MTFELFGISIASNLTFNCDIFLVMVGTVIVLVTLDVLLKE